MCKEEMKPVKFNNLSEVRKQLKSDLLEDLNLAEFFNIENCEIELSIWKGTAYLKVVETKKFCAEKKLCLGYKIALKMIVSIQSDDKLEINILEIAKRYKEALDERQKYLYGSDDSSVRRSFWQMF